MKGPAWLLPVLCLSLPAQAHEGEAHGVTTSTVPGQMAHVLAATGDAFEVVLKHPEHVVAPKTPLRLWVADAETNAPVSGAHVELTLTGATVQTLVPRMESAGLYVVEAALSSDSELAAVVTVTRGDVVDVLALGTVHAEPEDEDAREDGPGRLGWSVTGGGVLLMGAGAWWVARRKRGAS